MARKKQWGRLLILAFFLYLLIPAFWKVYQMHQDKEALKLEVLELSEKNQTLEREIRLLQEDPVYLEHVARKKFHKAREGEVVYQWVAPAES